MRLLGGLLTAVCIAKTAKSRQLLNNMMLPTFTDVAAEANKIRDRPGHAIAIIIFPAAVFAIFGLLRINNPAGASFFLGSTLVLTVMGAAIYGWGYAFAAEIKRATEAEEGGDRRLRAETLLTGALAAVILALIGIAAVVVLAFLTSPLWLGLVQAIGLAIALIAGGVIFGLLATALIIWVPVRRYRIVLASVFWVSAFGSGIVVPPWQLPLFIWQASIVFPSRHVADMAWAPGLG